MGEGANSAIAAVLFTDLVGSTELRSRLGDRAADDIRRAHDHAFSAAVESCAGKVVKGPGAGDLRILGGELGEWEALVNRRMRMEGDMMTAMRMEAVFGGALELAGPDLD